VVEALVDQGEALVEAKLEGVEISLVATSAQPTGGR